MAVKLEMNPENNTIRLNGKDIPIPEEQREFFRTLKQKADTISAEKIEQDCNTVDMDPSNQSVIYFGYITVNPPANGEEEPIPEFIAQFKFDLKTYTLLDLKGKTLKSNKIKSYTPSRWKATETSPLWLEGFVNAWKSIMYSKTPRLLLKYMFEPDSYAKRKLMATEKLRKAGIICGTDRLDNLDGKNLSEMFGVPNNLIKLLKEVKTREDGMAEFNRLDWHDIRRFNKWEYINKVEDPKVCEHLVDLVSRDHYIMTGIFDLIDGHYNHKTFLEYLYYEVAERQGMDDINGVRVFRDYINMSTTVFGKVMDKYPKYLRSQHDILVQTYNKFKVEIDAKRLEEKMATIKELVDELQEGIEAGSKYYTWHVATTAEELKEEGKAMHNCVGSYSERVLNGDSIIIFWRKSESSYSYRRDSYITLELNPDSKQIVQAYRAYNSQISIADYKILEDYCERHGLTISKNVVPKEDPKPEIIMEGPEEEVDEPALVGAL